MYLVVVGRVPCWCAPDSHQAPRCVVAGRAPFPGRRVSAQAAVQPTLFPHWAPGCVVDPKLLSTFTALKVTRASPLDSSFQSSVAIVTHFLFQETGFDAIINVCFFVCFFVYHLLPFPVCFLPLLPKLCCSFSHSWILRAWACANFPFHPQLKHLRIGLMSP